MSSEIEQKANILCFLFFFVQNIAYIFCRKNLTLLFTASPFKATWCTQNEQKALILARAVSGFCANSAQKHLAAPTREK